VGIKKMTSLTLGVS